MNSSPAVSVVMPIYNAEPYLRKALDSVISQTLADIEIICVNDGSKDSSLDTMRSYAECDDRIVVIDKPNGGYGHTMNTGIEACHGDYIGILEPDDYIKPSMFEKLYKEAKANDLDFIRSNFYRLTTDKNGMDHLELEKACPNQSYYNCVLNPQTNVDLFNIRMENWTGIYKRSWIEAHKIRFNESPGAGFQDNGFWFQTYCLANRIEVLDEGFYCYRNDNAASSINQTDKVFVMLDEYHWMEQWLRSNPEICEKFIGIFHYKKTHNCEFALSRLAPEYRLMFLRRYADEYAKAFASNEIDENLFYQDELDRLKNIVKDPEGYAESLNALTSASNKSKLSLFAHYAKEEGALSAIKRAIRYASNRR